MSKHELKDADDALKQQKKLYLGLETKLEAKRVEIANVNAKAAVPIAKAEWKAAVAEGRPPKLPVVNLNAGASSNENALPKAVPVSATIEVPLMLPSNNPTVETAAKGESTKQTVENAASSTAAVTVTSGAAATPVGPVNAHQAGSALMKMGHTVTERINDKLRQGAEPPAAPSQRA